MPYKKYEPGDELRVGLQIRLAGRIGAIRSIGHEIQNVEWDSSKANIMDLREFPELEIFVQPLTIPKALKDEITTQDTRFHEWVSVKELEAELANRYYVIEKKMIDSLEVTEE